MKRLLCFPGTGDFHWTALKLRDWLRRCGWGEEEVEVSIWDIDGRPRTLELLDLVPWVRKGDYFKMHFSHDQERFNSLYLHAGSKDAILDFHGYDALLGLNGSMRNGAPWDTLLDGAATDYAYGPIVPDAYGLGQRALGRYVVLGFSGFGMFAQDWTRCMPAREIKTLVAALRRRWPDRRFLFTGLAWDDAFTRACVTSADECLVGETPLHDFLSLLKHADAFVGWCGGNSILAQHLGTPTVVWWSRRYFPRHDRAGWATPHQGETVQLVLEVEDWNPTVTPLSAAGFIETQNARLGRG